MAVVFSRRPCGYKFGLLLLFFGVLLYVLGFASPYWYKLTTGLYYIHGGLWQTCVQVLMLKVCTSTPKGSVATDWMSIVQGMQCIGLVGLMLACIYGTVVNWIQQKPRYTRLLELFGIISGFLGFASCVIFIAQVENSPKELRKLGGAISVMGHARHTVSWALGLSLAACVFCLVASFILAVHNPCIPVETTPGVGGYTDPETGAVFPVIDAASQEVYYITSQPTPGGPGFQPMSSVFQPPPYESVAAPPPFSEYPPKFNH